VCISVIRRRATDLAVLRAIGMTPRGTRGVLAWQATTLSAVGLAVGLPLGIVLGRTIWRTIAQLTPLIFAPPLAALTLLLAVPVTLLIANALAVWPGRRAARLRPAELLHTE
jgi:ABC-type antimicrobial peptide transport system permease subunit